MKRARILAAGSRPHPAGGARAELRPQTGHQGRAWALLDLTVFAAALLPYAVAVPLGLARVESAPQVAAAVGLDTGKGTVVSVLAGRLLAYLPLGDLAARANLLSCLTVALAMGLLARLSVEIAIALRPPPSARQERRIFVYEPVAAGGAALAAALSLATFEVATQAGATAGSLAVLAAAWLAELALLRDIASAPAGLALASLAGLALGAGPGVGPVVWPILGGLALWALRRGAKWPVFAPLCFVATAGACLLAGRATASHTPSIGALWAPLSMSAEGRAGAWAAAVEAADQVGAVGTLLAGIGLVALAARAALVAAWLVLNLVSCLALTGLPAGAGRTALPSAIAVTCALACAGIVHVSARLGRARLAGAFVLGVILVFSPAMDGGKSRWLPRPLPMRLLDRALDKAEVSAVVDPGSAEMTGLLQLGQVIGLRPDLELRGRTRSAGR